jgi:hypothetical protein
MLVHLASFWILGPFCALALPKKKKL